MSKVQRFTRNTAGRDYVVGDIHGAFEALDGKLSAIGFNPDVDRLFCVGDLIDHGAQSIDWELWLGEDWFHTVQGDHEIMLQKFVAGEVPREQYEACGGGWLTPQPFTEQLRASEALSELPIAIEVETGAGLVGIVHADVMFEDWQQLVAALTDGFEHQDLVINHTVLSGSRIQEANHKGVGGIRAVVAGHTTVPFQMQMGNVRYIDTGGWLYNNRDFTILDLETLEAV